MICVPAAPGKMRLITRFFRNFFKTRLFAETELESWISLRFSKKIVQQDMALLTGLAMNVQNQAPILGATGQFDILVREWRKWESECLKHADPWFKGWPKQQQEEVQDIENLCS